jgi:hypothetical protein
MLVPMNRESANTGTPASAPRLQLEHLALLDHLGTSSIDNRIEESERDRALTTPLIEGAAQAARRAAVNEPGEPNVVRHRVDGRISCGYLRFQIHARAGSCTSRPTAAGTRLFLYSRSTVGVASALMPRALTRYLLRETRRDRVTVDPYLSNTRAVRAWRKAGFRPVEEREADADHGEPWLLMTTGRLRQPGEAVGIDLSMGSRDAA